MNSDLNALIEKIQKEGIQRAEEIAKEIEKEALLKAKQLKEEAKREAEEILSTAKKNIEEAKAKAEISLRQVSRDILITLRCQINKILRNLIELKIQEVLSTDELAKIISELIKVNNKLEKDTIVISVNSIDFLKLKNTFFDLLKEEIKKKIILKSSDEITAGFRISYDNEKSYFDFSDKALAEYLSKYLEPELNKILLSSLDNER